MDTVYFRTKRNGYSPTQCGRTLTVRELIDLLGEFDEDASVYFKNDKGYTYGSITRYDVEEGEFEE